MEADNQPRRNDGLRMELAEFMAPDRRLPDRGTPEWSAWVVGAAVHGHLLLLHVMAAIEDAPEGEAADLAWDDNIKAEIRKIHPGDAEFAVEAILGKASRWATESGYAAPYASLQRAVADTVDALVPPARREIARASVRDLALVVDEEPDLISTRYRILGLARFQPLEALYLAAVFTAVLWRTPECVPDPAAARLAVVEQTQDLLDKVSGRG